MIPACCLEVVGDQDVDERAAATVRRPLASCDPDLAALYERLVIAREGLRPAIRAALVEHDLDWFRAFCDIDDLVDRAQRRLEKLT